MNYKDIAQAYREYKEKEEAYKALATAAVAEMREKGMKKEVTEYGTFTVAERTSYEYMDKVKALQEKVDLAKIKEVEKGLAQARVSSSLRYTPPKAK